MHLAGDEIREKTIFKALVWLGGLSPLLGIAFLVVIARFGDLPNTETLANPMTDLATRVYSADGKILGSYYRENRADATYEDLPQHLVNALVATEDARFYKHDGVIFTVWPERLSLRASAEADQR